MSPLRVLSLSTLYPNPARPAFGKFVAAQMNTVAARGDIDLTVISPIGMPPWPMSLREPYKALKSVPKHLEPAEFPVHFPRFTLIPRIGGDSNPARIAQAVLPLARRLHEEAPFDLIDAQFFFPDGPAAAAIARALGLPLVIKARGSDIHYWGQRPRALSQMRAAAHQAARLLSVSRALGRDMAELGFPQGRIAAHYTGLDHAAFRVTDRLTARRAIISQLDMAIPPVARLLVTPGALIPIKGQRLAIAALAQVPGVHLALAGTGEDDTVLRQQARDQGLEGRVHFLGHVPHDMLPLLMSASDAMVLASEREGLANVWIEALACGTPIIIPDIGGAREVVMAESAGRITARTADAIAAAAREIFASPPDQQAVAQNAARFSWEDNAAALASHWREAAARPSF